MKRKIFLIALMMFVLISITCVSAVGNTQTLHNTTQHNASDFTTLNSNLNNNTANSHQLHKDYAYNSTKDIEYRNGIHIDRDNYVLDGNNHRIDACGKARIFNITSRNVTIKNLRFINANATDGSAIYSRYGLNLLNCIFENNTSKQSGGALFVEKGTSNNKIKSTFINNDAYNGGAIYFNSTVKNNSISGTFKNNTATRAGGAIYIKGTSTANDFTAKFYNNTAQEASGGAIFFYTTSQENLFGCIFRDNRAMYGAGIFFYNQSSDNIFNSSFSFNTAKSCGGAMFFNNKTDNNTFNGMFKNNTGLTGNGGAITFKDESSNSIFNANFKNNVAGAYGGAINFRQRPHNITFNGDFTSNHANVGGAVNFFEGYDNVIFNGSFIKNHAVESGNTIAS